eukprot:768313-Hanusia_phi.AAC.2
MHEVGICGVSPKLLHFSSGSLLEGSVIALSDWLLTVEFGSVDLSEHVEQVVFVCHLTAKTPGLLHKRSSYHPFPPTSSLLSYLLPFIPRCHLLDLSILLALPALPAPPIHFAFARYPAIPAPYAAASGCSSNRSTRS